MWRSSKPPSERRGVRIRPGIPLPGEVRTLRRLGVMMDRFKLVCEAPKCRSQIEVLHENDQAWHASCQSGFRQEKKRLPKYVRPERKGE